jgi:hypothetical protein
MLRRVKGGAERAIISFSYGADTAALNVPAACLSSAKRLSTSASSVRAASRHRARSADSSLLRTLRQPASSRDNRPLGG